MEGSWLGRGPSVTTAQGHRDPLREQLGSVGQGRISARPEPAQHSALVLVLTSHTFWCIFTAASVATLNVNKTRWLFCLKPTTDFLPLIPRLHACPPLLVHFTQLPLSLQLPSDPETLGCSCPPGHSLASSPAGPPDSPIAHLPCHSLAIPSKMALPASIAPSMIFSSLLVPLLEFALFINLHAWHWMFPKLDREFREHRGLCRLGHSFILKA